MMRKLENSSAFGRRVRLSSHGIVLAMLVTVAAAIFLVAALRAQAPAFDVRSFDARGANGESHHHVQAR